MGTGHPGLVSAANQCAALKRASHVFSGVESTCERHGLAAGNVLGGRFNRAIEPGGRERLSATIDFLCSGGCLDS